MSANLIYLLCPDPVHIADVRHYKWKSELHEVGALGPSLEVTAHGTDNTKRRSRVIPDTLGRESHSAYTSLC